MVIFRFLGQNGLKLELRTFAVEKILMDNKTKISSEFIRENKP